ncbi:MarR family transcriptional regulator [Neobacillus notoginsengisoli]|uniref:MarR family transcriptional regulator n=1 Tax=Neobacillus notoginsengisoli TaxID=1578198 RepID=A0A417YWD4_9BACI|nr:MarR family transcriptional regulator [Neobacillus notoginsengisoli]RHW41733.1 MarR family transcriptional regulator [Neobacillus notoginsengisoli]
MDSEISQKLINTFMQFRKTGWHTKKIAGCNPSEFKLLIVIKKGMNEGTEAMKVSEISQKLQVTPPTVTQLINVLEKDGLVERTIDPKDRRAVKIRLTEQGLEVTLKAKQAFRETFLGLIDHLGEEDSHKLAELLEKVNEYFLNESKREGKA